MSISHQERYSQFLPPDNEDKQYDNIVETWVLDFCYHIR